MVVANGFSSSGVAVWTLLRCHCGCPAEGNRAGYRDSVENRHNSKREEVAAPVLREAIKPVAEADCSGSRSTEPRAFSQRTFVCHWEPAAVASSQRQSFRGSWVLRLGCYCSLCRCQKKESTRCGVGRLRQCGGEGAAEKGRGLGEYRDTLVWVKRKRSFLGQKRGALRRVNLLAFVVVLVLCYCCGRGGSSGS